MATRSPLSCTVASMPLSSLSEFWIHAPTFFSLLSYMLPFWLPSFPFCECYVSSLQNLYLYRGWMGFHTQNLGPACQSYQSIANKDRCVSVDVGDCMKRMNNVPAFPPSGMPFSFFPPLPPIYPSIQRLSHLYINVPTHPTSVEHV